MLRHRVLCDIYGETFNFFPYKCFPSEISNTVYHLYLSGINRNLKYIINIFCTKVILLDSLNAGVFIDLKSQLHP